MCNFPFSDPKAKYNLKDNWKDDSLNILFPFTTKSIISLECKSLIVTNFNSPSKNKFWHKVVKITRLNLQVCNSQRVRISLSLSFLLYK